MELAQAVKAVQEACGALNDAKVELLGSLSESALREYQCLQVTLEKEHGPRPHLLPDAGIQQPSA